MSERKITLGNFPPGNSWGVFHSTTCPDLGGGFMPPHLYHRYVESPEMFTLLLRVKETLDTLGIRPEPDFIYPTVEEIQNWGTEGEAAWRARSKC